STQCRTVPLCVSVSPAPSPAVFYTLSLHDALPIYLSQWGWKNGKCRRLSQKYLGKLEDLAQAVQGTGPAPEYAVVLDWGAGPVRSEEHTSELQSLAYLVCRLLLEKKKNK